MTQSDYLTLEELSAHLGWSTRFIEELTRDKQLPSVEVDGQRRFHREAVADWLDQKVQSLESRRLAQLEKRLDDKLRPGGQTRLTDRLSLEAIGIDIPARNTEEVVAALLDHAEKTGNVRDRAVLQASILEREALYPTALPGGIAICHPRRPIPSAIRDTLLAFVRVAEPIPFGADNGAPTRLFFLLCAPSDTAHLHGLARLARLLDSITLAELQHNAPDANTVLRLLREREATVTA